MDKRRLQIAIIGSAGPEEYPGKKPNSKAYEIAEKLGREIANKDAVLVCGGKGGIMEAACKGAKSVGGITTGVISGNNRGESNPYVDVEVVSGMLNCAEESLIISMSDALIVLGGGSGTLQEIALAYRNDKPVVVVDGLDGWGKKLANTYLDYRKKFKIISAKNAEEAIDIVFNKLLSSKEKI
jgi:uncharacterized protein (TIGR00725 family)